jgi:hypothetical protein
LQELYHMPPHSGRIEHQQGWVQSSQTAWFERERSMSVKKRHDYNYWFFNYKIINSWFYGAISFLPLENLSQVWQMHLHAMLCFIYASAHVFEHSSPLQFTINYRMRNSISDWLWKADIRRVISSRNVLL